MILVLGFAAIMAHFSVALCPSITMYGFSEYDVTSGLTIKTNNIYKYHNITVYKWNNWYCILKNNYTEFVYYNDDEICKSPNLICVCFQSAVD